MSGRVGRILRLKDPLVQDLVKIATKKDFRNARQRCVVAGTKLVRDLGRHYRFHELLVPQNDSLAGEDLGADERYVADARSLRRIAQLTSFEGLVATLDLPRASKDLMDPRLILCIDYVEDPGLLGTLLRTAVAFQWQAAFFLPHCVDHFHPRCVRASQGALFEIPHARGTMEDLQKLCRKKGLTLCVSHPEGADIGSATYAPPNHGMALLLREEYASPWAPPKAAEKIKLPDPWRQCREAPADGQAFEPRALDVAVAGGILMHHIKSHHYPKVSRSAYVASPRARAGPVRR